MTNILFFDVDGTLLTMKDGEQYVPPSAIAAMAEARARGCRSYLCTGRSLAEARSVGDLPVDGIIGAAGGFVLDGDTMVYHRALGEDAVCRIEAYLRSRGGSYYLECNSGLFFDDEFLAYVRTHWGIEGNHDFEAIMHGLADVDRTEVNKVSFRMPSDTSFDDVLDALGEDFYACARPMKARRSLLARFRSRESTRQRPSTCCSSISAFRRCGRSALVTA